MIHVRVLSKTSDGVTNTSTKIKIKKYLVPTKL